jgi:hypothetical protein
VSRNEVKLILLIGGLSVLSSIAIVVWLVHDYSQLQRYQAGQCTITAKQLLAEVIHETHKTGSSYTTTTSTEYRPVFQFTVHSTDGRSYPAQGYDALGIGASDRASQQAIVDQYRLGETYPCWYDPANPTQAVLTLQYNWFGLILAALFLFLGAMCVYVALKSRPGAGTQSSQTQRCPTCGSPVRPNALYCRNCGTKLR